MTHSISLAVSCAFPVLLLFLAAALCCYLAPIFFYFVWLGLVMTIYFHLYFFVSGLAKARGFGVERCGGERCMCWVGFGPKRFFHVENKGGGGESVWVSAG